MHTHTHKIFADRGCASPKFCVMVIAPFFHENRSTVKPALSDHPTVQEKVVVIDRWSLKQGSLNSGRFSEVLFNIGELRGTHAYDLRNDKSHRPGASGGLVWWFSRKLALWRLFLKRMWGQSSDKTGKIRPLVQKIRVAGRVRQVVA